MEYSDLEKQKVDRRGLGVWQLFERLANVLMLPTQAFQKRFWSCVFLCHSPVLILMLFLALGTKEIRKRPLKTVLLTIQGSWCVIYKVLVIFKATITQNACGIRDDEKTRSLSVCERVCPNCITSFSSQSHSAFPVFPGSMS